MTRAAGSTSPGGTNRATLKRTSTEGKLLARKCPLKTTNRCFLMSPRQIGAHELLLAKKQQEQRGTKKSNSDGDQIGGSGIFPVTAF